MNLLTILFPLITLLSAIISPSPLSFAPDVHAFQLFGAVNETAEPQIRVLILESARDARISSPGEIILEVEGNMPALGFPPGKELRISAWNSTLQINGASVMGTKAVFSSRGNVVSVNGRKYRGCIRVTGSLKRVDVVNILGVESYLRGVVPREMNGSWDIEALKAQAVVARTYALYHMQKNRDQAFDVCSTTNTQVYGGVNYEAENANSAVSQTNGMVLVENDQPALVYYHANSAGITEDPVNVWKIEVPYLRSRQDAFSLKAADTGWSCSMTMWAIRKALEQKVGRIGKISDIKITAWSESGRVKQIVIRHGRGEKLYLSGSQFRTIMDPAALKSALFTIKKSGKSVTFEGRGAGHGVGMSQWGAYMMAREGFSCPEILEFYYPGLQIRK